MGILPPGEHKFFHPCHTVMQSNMVLPAMHTSLPHTIKQLSTLTPITQQKTK